MSRKHWTEAMFKQDLLDMCKVFNRFPSCSELVGLGRGDLANQIQKRGGFLRWSEETGYARKPSDSDTGWHGETEVAAILEGKGYVVTKRETNRAPYDMVVNGFLRVDVKTTTFSTYTREAEAYTNEGWFYRIGKFSSADVFAFFQSDTKDLFFIPWFECPTGNISITRTGKYQIFKNDYALLDFMIGVRQGEVEKVRALKIAA